MALLGADVSYAVVKSFVDSLKEKAVGEKILESLTPSQHIIKIVKYELEKLLGSEEQAMI